MPSYSYRGYTITKGSKKMYFISYSGVALGHEKSFLKAVKLIKVITSP
jgi:hypothetical protein